MREWWALQSFIQDLCLELWMELSSPSHTATVRQTVPVVREWWERESWGPQAPAVRILDPADLGLVSLDTHSQHFTAHEAE